MSEVFDATKVQPKQGGANVHPRGIFPARIETTKAEKAKNTQSGMITIEFSTPAGKITNRYNYWNENETARKIAHEELSCLCHATGVFNVAVMPVDQQGNAIPTESCSQLRGAMLMIEVDHQIDKNGKPTKYMEVKQVFNQQGMNPAKPNDPPVKPETRPALVIEAPQDGFTAASTTQQNQAPPEGWNTQQTTQQQPQGQQTNPPQDQQGGWGNNQPQQQNNSGWNNNAQPQQQNAQPQQEQQNNNSGWSQASAGGKAPW